MYWTYRRLINADWFWIFLIAKFFECLTRKYYYPKFSFSHQTLLWRKIIVTPHHINIIISNPLSLARSLLRACHLDHFRYNINLSYLIPSCFYSQLFRSHAIYVLIFCFILTEHRVKKFKTRSVCILERITINVFCGFLLWR